MRTRFGDGSTLQTLIMGETQEGINHKQFGVRKATRANTLQRCKTSQVFTIYEVQHNGFMSLFCCRQKFN